MNDEFIFPIPSTSPLHRLREDYALKTNKRFLIIEGINDKKVYDRIKNDNCEVHLSGSKASIIEDFEIVYNNQIAIVDKDYDDNDIIENLYYTDYNDLECTAINIMNDSNKLYKSINIDSISEEKFKEKIYMKALELSCLISTFNYLIYKYNQKYNKKYPYLLKLFINEDKQKKSIGDIKKISTILSKKNNLKTEEIVNLYKKEYKSFDISYNDIQKAIDSNIDNGFRGHDFFIVLAYLIDYYNLKINFETYKEENEYKSNPSIFLEKRFINYFSNTERIKESKMYKEIKNTKDDFLK